eukprot:TRINITY_DN9639_c3_g1_i1.p1 TRINITY_DN9639_c3_g1~~TRINITY_DN9639_c3_g1_i1.p1  ORF type:complete len:902 (+),score=278.91 TRINITY_DN9639_c3_g1_i1:60-2765(+)
MRRLLLLAGCVLHAAATERACEGLFGDDLPSAALQVTVVDAGTGAGLPSDGGPVVHFASPQAACMIPRPTECRRYFKWYYSNGCRPLSAATPNISLGAGHGKFDPRTGVLVECKPWAVDVLEFCLGVGSEPCQCPATVLPPEPPAHVNETDDSSSGSDDDGGRVIFSDSPITDVLAVLLFPTVAAVATTAGVGGGGIYVPMLIIMCSFNPKSAAGLSQALIFGACSAALIHNVRRKHPTAGKEPGRPLIDYEMALFLSPMEMAGALVGVIINIMLPTWLLQALMFVVLGYTAYKTHNKGMEKYKAEKAALKKKKQQQGDGGEASPGIHMSPVSAMAGDDIEADVGLLSGVLQGSMYMVDIRNQSEREKHGAIISAQHVEMDEVLHSGLPEFVDKEAEIIVVGQAGGERATKVREHLRQTGFANVKVLKGGMDKWNERVPSSYQGKPLPSEARMGARELARRAILGMAVPYAVDIRTEAERRVDLDDEILRATIPENHIPAEDIIEGRRLPDCAKTRTILLVGVGHMQRSARVHEELLKSEFTDVRVLVGGLKAWRELVISSGDDDCPSPTQRTLSRMGQWQVGKATSLPVGGSSSWPRFHSGGQLGAAAAAPAAAPALAAVPVPAAVASSSAAAAAAPAQAPAAPALPAQIGFGLWKRAPRTKEQIVAEEGVQYPARIFVTLLVVWLFLIFLILAKGGKKTDSAVGIESCTGAYWGVWAGSLLFLLAVAAHFAVRAVITCKEKQLCGYEFLPTDIKWTANMTLFCSAATFGAGVIAGIMGIGGGMVLGPLMLQLGVDGRVSSATTATMIALTSSSAVIAFFVAGIVPPTYAVTLSIVCFVGAYVGKMKLDRIVKKRNLTALIVLLLAGIIGVASTFVLVLGAVHWNDLRVKGEMPGFNDPC